MHDVIVELAFGADLSAHPSTWSWVDVSADLLHSDVSIQRGRSDESGQVQPTTASFELDNLQGHYTPDNPVSPFYPDVLRGTPCRISVPSPERHLVLDGSTTGVASTPDHTSLDITGDIDLRAEVEIGWQQAGNQVLLGKWQTAGNQRSYLIRIYGGELVLNWSVDGTDSGQMAARWPLPGSLFGRTAVRATLDANNGAGGWTATFSVAPTLTGTWTQVGEPVVGTGTTSIFSSTAPLQVAPNAPDTTPPRVPFTGRGYRFQVRSGLGGSIVANPDFTTQAGGTTSFSDSAGRPWTVTSPAEVTDRRVRFLGHVDEWAPTWPYGDRSATGGAQPESRVHVAASGMFRRMSQGAKSLQSTLYRRITSPQMAANVIAYWPFEDGPEASAAASPIPGVRPLGVSPSVEFGRDDTLPASMPLAQASGGAGLGWSGTVPRAPAGAWRVDLFVRIPTPATSPAWTPLFVVNSVGTIRQWILAVNDINIRLQGKNAAGAMPVSSTAGSPPDLSVWHSVSLRVNQSGGNVQWGVEWIPLGGPVGFFFADTTPGQAGRVTSVANLYVAPSGGVSFGHLIVTRGLELFWLIGADTAFAGETADQRISRLCTEEGMPLLVHGMRGASEPVGPQRPVPLLDLLQEAASADMGLLYERRDAPGLEYRTRRSFRNQPAALALDAGAGDIVNPFEPILDDQRLRNDVTVSRDGGSSARVVDQTSVDREGRYDEQVTVSVASDLQLEDQAAWRLHLGTWPGMRYPTLTTDLVVAPQLVDEWLAVDLGDRVRASNLPPQHPADAVDLLVEGYAETLTPTEWAPKLNCSPAGPWTVGEIHESGDPTLDMARLDSDGSALAAAITPTQTTLGVSITAGPRWTTAAADLPFDIVVGGERIRVTQVTGTSSPQTFTVQRSINQIVKPHPAGTPVRVAQPFALDL